MTLRFSALFLLIFCLVSPVFAQVSAGAGTIEGTVTDPTGASIPAATVTITNPVSGLQPSATTGADGAFTFRNVPPNPYHLAVTANGFANKAQDVEVRSTVPVNVKITLRPGRSRPLRVNVEATAQDLVETVPSAHTDMDQALYSKMPLSSGSGMADLITLGEPRAWWRIRTASIIRWATTRKVRSMWTASRSPISNRNNFRRRFR